MGSLKVYLPKGFDWLFLLTLIGISAVTSFAAAERPLSAFLRDGVERFKRFQIMLVGWIIFSMGISLAGLSHGGAGLDALFKYAALFAVLCVFVSFISVTSSMLERALFASLVITFVILVGLILFRQTEFLVILGDGRIGWLANWPGSVWKIGALIWPAIVWKILRQPTFWNWSFAILACSIMAIDGSRTALLWAILSWVALSVIFAVMRVAKASGLVQLMIVSAILIAYLLIQPLLSLWVTSDLFERIFEFMNGTAASSGPVHSLVIPDSSNQLGGTTTVDRVSTGDISSRLELIKGGWEQAMRSFPWGSGFGVPGVNQSTVTHLTYLQLVGEVGVMGLIGYVLILFAPMYIGLKYVFEKRDSFLERFELLMLPIAILVFFAFTGLFHPISNELNEWAMLLVSVSIIMRYVPIR